LTQRRNEVREGKDPEITKRIKNHIFNELASQYESWVERQKSFGSKKYFIAHLKESFGNIPLRQISTRLVEEYQSRMLSQEYAPASVNRHLACLKHMVRKGCEWEMLSEEILKRVRRVKLLPENNRRLRYLSIDECRKLTDSCNPLIRPIVIAALNTGMRKGEILSLEWEKHIDLRHGFILLDQTKNGERREIPINQTLRGILTAIPRRIDCPYVFTDEEGKRFKDVTKRFQSACRKAGIKDLHFHDLRHTFASQLVMAGVDLTTVKELLGHHDFKMTLRYAHLAPAHKHNAVSILDRALNREATIQKLDNRPEMTTSADITPSALTVETA
jgi:integrase